MLIEVWSLLIMFRNVLPMFQDKWKLKRFNIVFTDRNLSHRLMHSLLKNIWSNTPQ